MLATLAAAVEDFFTRVANVLDQDGIARDHDHERQRDAHDHGHEILREYHRWVGLCAHRWLVRAQHGLIERGVEHAHCFVYVSYVEYQMNRVDH